MFPLPPLLHYIIRPRCPVSRLFPYLWRRKHNYGSADGVGCGWRLDAGVMALLSVRGRPACLTRGDGRGGSVISSPHLIGSSNRLGSRVIPSTGRWFLFLFRPTPSRLLFSACLPWLVPPSPAGGCVGCGMACGGGREGLFACLLSCPCRSLTAFVRSLLYASCRLRRCAYFGRCWAFYGIF